VAPDARHCWLKFSATRQLRRHIPLTHQPVHEMTRKLAERARNGISSETLGAGRKAGFSLDD
jgi:hypothetical protein